MDFRFTAHDPQTGDFLHRLPRPEKVQIGDTFGTRGTLDLTYSSKTLNAKQMPTFVEIRQEATFDGGMTWAQIGPNYLRLSGSHEDTDQAGMRTVKLVSREWLLGKARVGAGDLPLIDNKRPFYQSSPGAIMRTLLLEAKDRGAAQGIEIGGFSASKDSSGNDWPKVATIYYQPSLPILSVLENLVEQGLCDYRMDGNTMRLYAPETTMGRDLTLGADPVRVHGHVTEAPVNYTLEDLTTSALLIGEDGFEVEVDNPSAPDDYGRLEATIEQGGVSDEGTARVMIDETLQKGSREIREITRTQRVDGLKHVPYRDYRVGDFVQVRDQGAWERYRVREIQLVRDKDGWTAHTVINDRLQELLLKLAKRTSGIVNGSQGAGGDGTPPAPPPRPGIEPAAPEGLVIDQQVYLDRQGIARGQITASWSPVTESVRDKAIDIGGYELWWRRNETYAEWTRAVATTGDDTSVTHSPVVLSDVDGNAMAYQWRVRAVAQESARPGPFSDAVTLTMTQDTDAPNQPSLPEVTTEFRIVTVKIDGLDEFGEAMPVDFNHFRIYFATTANMADAVQVGTLSQMGSWNSETMAPDAPVYVAVTAVDNVGNESSMTSSQVVTPKNLVDDDSIRDAIESAKVDAIEESVTTAGGRRVHNKTTPPVNSPNDKEFDVWQQWSTLEEGATLLGAWMHNGTSWVKRDITEEYVPRIHIGEGTFGVMSGQRLEAGSVTADKVIVGDTGNAIADDEYVTLGAPHWDVGSATIGVPRDWSAGKPTIQVNSSNGLGRIYYGGDGLLPCEEGEAWRLRFQKLIFNPPATEGEFNANIQYYDAAGNHVAWNGRVDFWESGNQEWCELVSTVPAGASQMRLYWRMESNGSGIGFTRPSLSRQAGATLIEDGAITTSKIRALAIEADHISANAITADKIRAGAIDGKLITGARIRTAASGRRTELDVEGMRSYDSSGNVVLTTDTSDGSIEMKGRLRQTSQGVTMLVGSNFRDGFPAIQWETSTNYYYSPGVTYQEINDYPETLVQGPGSTSGNSLITLGQYGNKFWLRSWKGSNDTASRSWNVEGDLADNFMRIGSGSNSQPNIVMNQQYGGQSRYASMRSGSGSNLTIANEDVYMQAAGGGIYMRRNAGGNGGDWGFISIAGEGIFLDSQGRDMFFRSARYYFPVVDQGQGAPLGRIDGQLVSMGSARKYKLIEEPLEATVESVEDKLLSIEPKTWIDRTAAERVADYETAIANGEEPEQDLKGCGRLDRIPGVIAEDLEAAGLDMFVGYQNGEPEWVMYDRIGPALIPIIRRLRDRERDLERRVDVLEQQLGEQHAA